jgi:hypothetical protein
MFNQTFYLWPFEWVITWADRVIFMIKLWGHPAIVLRVWAAGIQATLTRIDFCWGRDEMDCAIYRFTLTRGPLDSLESAGYIKYRQLPFGWRFRRCFLSA